jgi:hypothetical protein
LGHPLALPLAVSVVKTGARTNLVAAQFSFLAEACDALLGRCVFIADCEQRDSQHHLERKHLHLWSPLLQWHATQQQSHKNCVLARRQHNGIPVDRIGCLADLGRQARHDLRPGSPGPFTRGKRSWFGSRLSQPSASSASCPLPLHSKGIKATSSPSSSLRAADRRPVTRRPRTLPIAWRAVSATAGQLPRLAVIVVASSITSAFHSMRGAICGANSDCLCHHAAAARGSASMREMRHWPSFSLGWRVRAPGIGATRYPAHKQLLGTKASSCCALLSGG